MTKVFLQPGLRGLSGGMGDWVYQIRNGKTVVGMKPLNVYREPTESQQVHRQRFAEAAAYAKRALADPEKRAFYQEAARAKDIPAFSLAVADYLKVPTFKAFDASEYHGQVGDPLLIQAADDLGFAVVPVTLSEFDGTPIESGNAVETGPRSGIWVYTSTTSAAPGTELMIEVVGIDHAGHEAQISEDLIVTAQD